MKRISFNCLIAILSFSIVFANLLFVPINAAASGAQSGVSAPVTGWSGPGTVTSSDFPGLSGLQGEMTLVHVGDAWKLIFNGVAMGPGDGFGCFVYPSDEGVLVECGAFYAIFNLESSDHYAKF